MNPTMYDVTINKKGNKVYHVWEAEPVSPICKVFKYEYSLDEIRKAPEGNRGIETKIVYKSIDYSSFTLVEIRSELANLRNIFEGNISKSNPYYLTVVNIGSVETPRWYPLPLLFAPMVEQERTNKERGYSELPRSRIYEIRENILAFFNYRDKKSA